MEPTLYHRCRGCGALFRMSWISAIIVVVVQLLWFALEKLHIISPYIALVLLLVTFGLAVWLLPYLTPTRLKGRVETQRP